MAKYKITALPKMEHGGPHDPLPAEYLKSHGEKDDKGNYQMKGFEKAVNQDLDSLLGGSNTDGFDAHWYGGDAESYGVTSDQLRGFASENRPKGFVNAAAYTQAMNKLANDAGAPNVSNIPFADNPMVMRTADDDIEYIEYEKPTTLQEEGYIDETGTKAVNLDKDYKTGLAKRYGRNRYDHLVEKKNGGPHDPPEDVPGLPKREDYITAEFGTPEYTRQSEMYNGYVKSFLANTFEQSAIDAHKRDSKKAYVNFQKSYKKRYDEINKSKKHDTIPNLNDIIIDSFGKGSVERLAKDSQTLEEEGLVAYTNPETGETQIFDKVSINKKIYNNGLRGAELEKVTGIPEDVINKEFKEAIDYSHKIYDSLNIKNIHKSISQGKSVGEAVDELVKKGQGTKEGLTSLFKERGDEAQDKLLKHFRDSLPYDENKDKNLSKFFDPQVSGKQSLRKSPIDIYEQHKARIEQEAHDRDPEVIAQRERDAKLSRDISDPLSLPEPRRLDIGRQEEIEIDPNLAPDPYTRPNIMEQIRRIVDGEDVDIVKERQDWKNTPKMFSDYASNRINKALIDELDLNNPDLSSEEKAEIIKRIQGQPGPWNTENYDEHRSIVDPHSKFLKDLENKFTYEHDPSNYYKYSDLKKDQPSFLANLFDKVTGTNTFSDRPPIYSIKDGEYDRAAWNQKMKPKGTPVGEINLPTENLIGFDLTVNPFIGGLKTGKGVHSVLKNAWKNPLSKTVGLDKLGQVSGLSKYVPKALTNANKFLNPRDLLHFDVMMKSPGWAHEGATENIPDAIKNFSAGKYGEGAKDLGWGAFQLASANPWLRGLRNLKNLKGSKNHIDYSKLQLQKEGGSLPKAVNGKIIKSLAPKLIQNLQGLNAPSTRQKELSSFLSQVGNTKENIFNLNKILQTNEGIFAPAIPGLKNANPAYELRPLVSNISGEEQEILDKAGKMFSIRDYGGLDPSLNADKANRIADLLEKDDTIPSGLVESFFHVGKKDAINDLRNPNSKIYERFEAKTQRYMPSTSLGDGRSNDPYNNVIIADRNLNDYIQTPEGLYLKSDFTTQGTESAMAKLSKLPGSEIPEERPLPKIENQIFPHLFATDFANQREMAQALASNLKLNYGKVKAGDYFIDTTDKTEDSYLIGLSKLAKGISDTDKSGLGNSLLFSGYFPIGNSSNLNRVLGTQGVYDSTFGLKDPLDRNNPFQKIQQSRRNQIRGGYLQNKIQQIQSKFPQLDILDKYPLMEGYEPGISEKTVFVPQFAGKKVWDFDNPFETGGAVDGCLCDNMTYSNDCCPTPSENWVDLDTTKLDTDQLSIVNSPEFRTDPRSFRGQVPFGVRRQQRKANKELMNKGVGVYGIPIEGTTPYKNNVSTSKTGYTPDVPSSGTLPNSNSYLHTDLNKIKQAILHPFDSSKRIHDSFKNMKFSRWSGKKKGLKKGGTIETELSQRAIDDLVKQGYIVEDV